MLTNSGVDTLVRHERQEIRDRLSVLQVRARKAQWGWSGLHRNGALQGHRVTTTYYLIM